MKPFHPNAKQTLKNYYEVPVDVLEDGEQLTTWAARAGSHK
jgi:DNA transformation protein